MISKLKVTFDDPEHGWIGLSLNCANESVTIIASYTPTDSLLDLINALYNLYLYSGEAKVIWHSGSTEYQFCFCREGDLVGLVAYEYPDHLRHYGRGEEFFKVRGSYEEVCLPLRRALRSLQGRYSCEELNRRWQRLFPSEEINGLTRLLQEGD